MHFVIFGDDDRWPQSIWLDWLGALLHQTQAYFNFLNSYVGADIQVQFGLWE